MKFIRLQLVIQKTGLSKSTIYAMIAAGNFPKQIQSGLRSVCWVEDQVEQWMLDRIRESTAET
jgi:prophage regulatory protein